MQVSHTLKKNILKVRIKLLSKVLVRKVFESWNFVIPVMMSHLTGRMCLPPEILVMLSMV